MKTAVILSARKERDTLTPYPLTPFNGKECLMDRTLQILQTTGYKHIFIVAGFCADEFMRYKTDDVSIIVNPSYEFTASMGSLALLKNFIKEDFLLVEGDTFYERYIIEQLSKIEHGNCLTMTEESGSGDECFVETKNGFVTKITKERHCVTRYEGELMGISRITLQTYQKMLLTWESSNNPILNYEYVFMEVTEALDRPVLYFKNIIWGDVDCEEDFRHLQNDIWRKLRKKENPYDSDNLKQHLKTIFPKEDISQVEITQIGGMSNKNFLVKLSNCSYVLRVPGIGSTGMVNRHYEEYNDMEAGRMGITPKIKYFNEDTGIKLTDFIDDAETLNSATIQRHENMDKVANIYWTLHNSHIRQKNEFNIFHEIEKYNTLINEAKAQMYDGWENVLPKIITLEKRLNNLGVDLKPCHNDAVAENFIKSIEGTIYLIDWEYSGMNDPLADFAALFLENNFTEENQNYLLNRYFGDTTPPCHYKEKIICYQILWDYLWAEWTVIKEAKGDDFGEYGTKRYHRAIGNLDKLFSQY